MKNTSARAVSGRKAGTEIMVEVIPGFNIVDYAVVPQKIYSYN